MLLIGLCSCKQMDKKFGSNVQLEMSTEGRRFASVRVLELFRMLVSILIKCL